MIIGIDLGTSNSSAACFVDGSLVLIPNDRGQRLTPSVLAFLADGRVLVGEGAVNQAVLYPDAVVREAKRHMGSGFVFSTPQGNVTPVMAARIILERLRRQASEFLFQEVSQAVIAVPAHFGDAARQATLEAARLAGWDVVRLLNEPTAAALQHLGRMKDQAQVMVYDFGGGTFDASLVRKQGDRLRVLASTGDAAMGGKDLDRLLALQAWRQACHQRQAALPQDPATLWRLMRAAEACKIDLSSDDKGMMAVPDPDGSARDLPVQVDRKSFEHLIDRHIRHSLQLCRELMKRGGVAASSLDAILLSGGTSRIPLARQALQDQFPKIPLIGMNPDEAVALGAAWYGHLHAQGQACRLEEVASFDLGLLVDEKDFYPLIPRNSLLPAHARQTFTTIEHDQEEARISILQRDEAVRPLGDLDLKNLRQDARGKPVIEVSFSLDENEVLTVQARDVHGDAQGLRIVRAGSPGSPVQAEAERRQLLLAELDRALAIPGLPEGLRAVLAQKKGLLTGGPAGSAGLDLLEQELAVLLEESRAWLV